MSEFNFSNTKSKINMDDDSIDEKKNQKSSHNIDSSAEFDNSSERFDIRDMENLRSKILKHEDFVEKLVDVLKSKSKFGLKIKQTKQIQISVFFFFSLIL
jgi:hypothetical protein